MAAYAVVDGLDPAAQSRLERTLLLLPHHRPIPDFEQKTEEFADCFPLARPSISVVRAGHLSGSPGRLAGPERRAVLDAPTEGACYVYGALAALVGGFDYAVFVPEPSPAAADEVLALMRAMAGADLVIGGNGTQSGPAAKLIRNAMPAGAPPLRYPLSSFRAWRLPVLRRLPFPTLGDSAPAFHASTTLTAANAGARIVEVPIRADCCPFDSGAWLCKLMLRILSGQLDAHPPGV